MPDDHGFPQASVAEFSGLRELTLEDGVKVLAGKVKETVKSDGYKYKAVQVDSIDEEKGQVSSYVSTYQWDRTRERFNKGAWMLEAFKKNPVVLWAHQSWNIPIGKNAGLEEDDKGLKAITQFDMENPFAKNVFRLYKEGYMNSFSVGFRPLMIGVEEMVDESGEKRNGLVFNKAELVEYSAVPVPANPGATLQRGQADLLLKEGLPGLLVAGEGDALRLLSQADWLEKELARPDLNDQAQYEATMKWILDLCKMHKGKKTLGEDKLALAKNAATALTELLNDCRGEISPEAMAEVNEAVKQLTKTVQEIYGDPRGTARKLMQAFNRSF
jgi:HK97 family phage prohead protease